MLASCSGAIMRSSLATMYHDGLLCHAACVGCAPKIEPDCLRRGCRKQRLFFLAQILGEIGLDAFRREKDEAIAYPDSGLAEQPEVSGCPLELKLSRSLIRLSVSSGTSLKDSQAKLRGLQNHTHLTWRLFVGWTSCGGDQHALHGPHLPLDGRS